MGRKDSSLPWWLRILPTLAFFAFIGYCYNQCERAGRTVEEDVRPARPRSILDGQFSGWDGSHYNVKEYVKDRMHNPSSFEHVETRYEVRNDSTELWVQMTYRGTNAFGGVVTNRILAKCTILGNVLSIEDQ